MLRLSVGCYVSDLDNAGEILVKSTFLFVFGLGGFWGFDACFWREFWGVCMMDLGNLGRNFNVFDAI